MDKEIRNCELPVDKNQMEVPEKPMILEEINIEELAVDGICGIY